MPSIEVIINAASGQSETNDVASSLTDIFASHGMDARINEAGDGAQLLTLAKQAIESDCEIVVACGGDGTISLVAGFVAASGKTLGVLPRGTLNHFAKDLQIPNDLDAAIAVIQAGRAITIDVGEVNGRVFINNSSLGLYPDVVRGRELRQRLGHGKWYSLLRSALTVFRRYPLLGIRMIANGKEMVTRTPFVFVGNNAYQIESFSIGARNRLDAGQLSVYMTRRSGRLALLRIAIRAVLGGLSQEKDFISAHTDELSIETRHRQIRVAIDGEVLMLESPIKYTIRPKALRVIAPENAAK